MMSLDQKKFKNRKANLLSGILFDYRTAQL